MQSILIAVILVLVVAGILIPAIRKDLKHTRETFAAPKPKSAISRLLQRLKDHLDHG